MKSEFIHLHNHSDNSLLDGAQNIPSVLETITDLGMDSVALTEQFANIYTFESPGGWNILGRTPLKLFDNKNKTRPCLLSPGDTVKFKSISEEEFNNFKNE